MSDIPPEIIRVILRHLPVKSLLRFRCVSKSWRSLIDDEDFIKLHLHHSTKTNSNRTLLVNSTKLFYLDLDTFVLLDTGNLRFKPRHVAGACNGLVLLVSDSNDIVLWNPSTRKLNELPRSFEGNCREGRYVFGYDSKHDDYRVLRVAQGCDWVDGGCMCSEATIYSLKTNSWKKVEDFPYMLDHNKTWGVYLNDALHTAIVHDDGSGAVIMAFDLAKEEHYMVPTPEVSGLASVEVMGGCLAAVVSLKKKKKKKNSIEIWVMKEYMVKGSWSKLFCFDPPIAEPCVNLCPLAYSKTGEEVLLNYEGICLNWYSLRNKTLTIASVDGLSASFGAAALDPLLDAWVCVESLVSPNSPGEVGIAKQNGGRGKKGREIKKKRDDFLSVGFKLVL
ncbi:hypothetical protein OROGR_003311 [Orobanche gracilis]